MRLLLVFAALAVVATAVVLALASSGSPSGVRAPTIQPAVARSGSAPPPPHGALVLAKGHGDLAVALAARRVGAGLRLTGTVLAADGTGLSGLQVRFAVAGRPLPVAQPCGPGCYASATGHGARARRISIVLSGRGRAPASVDFALPVHWPVSAAPLLRGAERVFRSLRGVVYHERLSSGPHATVSTVWRAEAPNRLSYRTTTGNAGVIIGGTRWDLVVGGGWQRSSQDPQLVMPAPPWGAGAYDISLLGGGRSGGRAIVRFSMFEPSTPAWYTVTLDRATLRTLSVSMTAAAHFMVDRYVAFDSPRQIRPPVGTTG